MRLGAVLLAWREREELSVRKAAEKIGVSHVTLNRLERGKPCGMETLSKVLLWLFGKA